jgi:nucleotide-binding universal stress UspA family protein
MTSSAPLIAAYKGSAGPDVLVFARIWSRTSGRPLRVVTLYPGVAPLNVGRGDAEWVAYNREEAEKLLESARQEVGDHPASFEAVASLSASHGLHDLLEAAGPDAVVILGSRRTRDGRRTAPGSTAERLLQGAPGPVALVPWDYENHAADPVKRVAVAFVDTPDGHAAVHAAAGLASELSAELQLVTVVPDTRVTPSMGEPHRFATGQESAFASALDAAAAPLRSDVPISTRVLEGPVVEALGDLRPDDADVLVCGSRGYGPVRRVLLGGVSSRLLRHARVPLIVVPRG